MSKKHARPQAPKKLTPPSKVRARKPTLYGNYGEARASLIQGFLVAHARKSVAPPEAPVPGPDHAPFDVTTRGRREGNAPG